MSIGLGATACICRAATLTSSRNVGSPRAAGRWWWPAPTTRQVRGLAPGRGRSRPRYSAASSARPPRRARDGPETATEPPHGPAAVRHSPPSREPPPIDPAPASSCAPVLSLRLSSVRPQTAHPRCTQRPPYASPRRTSLSCTNRAGQACPGTFAAAPRGSGRRVDARCAWSA